MALLRECLWEVRSLHGDFSPPPLPMRSAARTAACRTGAPIPDAPEMKIGHQVRVTFQARGESAMAPRFERVAT